ncbi:hypothetical protein [Desulfosporosinus sp. I2]|uniref:hypothetical protein n=1 Tax=Desulfosporosinus sp. I2 TaxID=1617025 RepID=UPI0005EF4DDF|nr:hypothetical protein [Desulfosporosinus sp. I2]
MDQLSKARSRIKNVLNYQRPAFWVLILAVVACLMISVGLMANPKNADPDLSFLNINNTAKVAVQEETLMIREHGRGASIISGNEFGQWLYKTADVLTGDYQRFSQIDGFAGTMQELSMVGEVDRRLLLAYTPNEERANAALMLVNPETMKIEKILEVGENFAATDVSLSGERIVIRLKDKLTTFKTTLEPSEVVSLPSTIIEKMNREPHYNAKGNPDIFFGGYDVSSDRLRYVYADESGVKLFDATDNSEKLLSQTVPITGSELLNNSFHSA